MRSDGRDNLMGALLIAGLFVIPEVSNKRLLLLATADRYYVYVATVCQLILLLIFVNQTEKFVIVLTICYSFMWREGNKTVNILNEIVG